jgi:hypothetical protein
MSRRDLEKVEKRIAEMRERRDLRWSMSLKTAEQAISAFTGVRAPRARPQSSKRRRRKRWKRLL